MIRLTSHTRLCRPVCLAGGLLLMLGGASSQEPAPEPGLSAFGRMVPQGYVNELVRIPSFRDGRPASLVTAATLTRLDDERLSAGGVVVELFAETPAQNVRVDMSRAIYRMSDKILRSGDRSRVSRSDFEVEGDSLVFDAATSQGSMKGRVRTLIFDTEALSGQSKASPSPRN